MPAQVRILQPSPFFFCLHFLFNYFYVFKTQYLVSNSRSSLYFSSRSPTTLNLVIMPWLLKAEPDSRIVKGVDVKYTIDDLEEEKVGHWEGIRNHEARKNLLAMKKGDRAFFYRSNCKQPAIVGTMTIDKEAHEDYFAKDPKHPYYDAKQTGKWVMVDVRYGSHLTPVLLSELRENPKLKNMALLKRSRLSVTPVTDEEFDEILSMAGVEPEKEPSKEADKETKESDKEIEETED